MNFINKLFIFILFSTVFLACNSSAEFKEDSLMNQWQMEKFIINGVDQSRQFNPKGDRKIIFNDDGSYFTKSEIFPETRGTFTINDNQLIMTGESKPNEIQEVTRQMRIFLKCFRKMLTHSK